MKKDYYEVLGVSRDASTQDIKKKYRSLALKHHPDRVPAEQKKEAEERFKEISEAYGVLSDPQKRKMYDEYGHAGIDQRYTAEDIFKGADFGDLGDIFSQFFGDSIFGGSFSSARGGSRQRRGADIQYEVEISLEEAYKGIKKKINVPRHEVCDTCNGSGAKPGTSTVTCSTCQGQGQVVTSSGFFRMAQTCPTCHGQGKTIPNPCLKCHGSGLMRVTRNIDVNIPAGVDNDTRLRVRGEGEVAQGGAGDLYLYINVKPHPEFERVGRDIQLNLGISFVKAALGSEVSVPTLNGRVTMKIPAGTQSGKVFRLKGKGMPDLRTGGHGEQYVRIMIEVPTRLSAEQRRLLEEFAETSGEAVGAQPDSFTEKIKKVFK